MAIETPTASELPVTRVMLTKVRDELAHRIEEVAHRIDQARLEAQADARRLEGQIKGVEGRVEGMQAQMSRIEVLVEEQNARNKVVLDGITALLGRQNQVEQRVMTVEETVRGLAARGPDPR